MHTDSQPIGEFLTGVVPEVQVEDIDDWNADERCIDRLHGVLVATDATVADMSYAEFCDAVLASGTTSTFTELVEIYDRDDAPAVYRVTGSRIVDPPRYFLDDVSAFLVLSGRYARADVATALYDPADFEDSALKYLDSYRLFSYPDRENRAEQLRRGNEIIEAIIETADQAQQGTPIEDTRASDDSV